MRIHHFSPGPEWEQPLTITRTVKNCWQCPYHERRREDTACPFSVCTRLTMHGHRINSLDKREICQANFPRWCPVKKGTVKP
jgi:hypothetical protein